MVRIAGYSEMRDQGVTIASVKKRSTWQWVVRGAALTALGFAGVFWSGHAAGSEVKSSHGKKRVEIIPRLIPAHDSIWGIPSVHIFDRDRGNTTGYGPAVPTVPDGSGCWHWHYGNERLHSGWHDHCLWVGDTTE